MIKTKTHIRFFVLLGLAVVLFLFSIFSYKIVIPSFRHHTLHKRFQEDFYVKEFQLDDLLDEWETYFADLDEKKLISDFIGQSLEEITREGINIFVYRNDSLLFWSTTNNPDDQMTRGSTRSDPIVFLDNGWYYKKDRYFGPVRVMGMVLIRTEFSYENRYLKNTFNPDLILPTEVDLKMDTGSPFPVYNAMGDYLFSLNFDQVTGFTVAYKVFALFCFFSGLFLFLLLLILLIRSITIQLYRNMGIILCIVILVLLDAILVNMKMPPQLESITLFSPFTFASSKWFPSLADLLITSGFVFFLAFVIYYHFDLNIGYLRKKPAVKHVVQFIYVFILGVTFQCICLLIRSLVLDSSINFEIYRVLNLGVNTFIGLSIIALLFSSWALLFDKMVTLLNPGAGIKGKVLYLVLFILIVTLSGWVISGGMQLLVILSAVIISMVMTWIRYSTSLKFKYSTFVLLILLFSLLNLYLVVHYSRVKQNNTKQVLAVDLSAEHDPVAELLLKEIENQITTDELLRDYVLDPFTDIQLIYDHLAREYFRSFWEKYELQAILCNPADSIYVEPPTDEVYHCYTFFDSLVASAGIQLPGSSFYFINNLNGRISYFASFDFYYADYIDMITLYLQLDSKLLSQELGYPELLLSEELKTGLSEQYSYARYHAGDLITQAGEYSFSLKSSTYTNGEKEYEFLTLEQYDLLVYNIDEANTIVMGHPRLKFLDVLISFTYIFGFFYLIVSISLFIINIPFFRKSIQLNIKNKIQYSMVIIIGLSLLLIAGGTIYFSARQFKQRHLESLLERTQSVYIELSHKLAFETSLQYEWQSTGYQNLEELLRKFSNVFFTDINLYDQEGNYLASSRPEIFDRGLQGTKMDPRAIYELSMNHKNEFVHEERIGTLNYLSAYVPFKNNDNQLLAYLNLPYFTRQDTLKKEISNLAVAIANFYVLLISLSVLLAIFFSNKITQPLRMIQNKISSFTLGKTNERIQYEGKDEIGSLVSEYNHMVDELARSAGLLAKSERESAWREMAKQIAHEIKNPLTPMKLNVQFLKKSWKDDPGQWEENLEKVSARLIEQIDELSSIATEFSNFAQMPKANNEEVDLRDRIRDVIGLYENTEDMDIEFTFNEDERVVVFTDKEQISRVFINLIKNAVQSIPDDRLGRIKINLDTDSDYAWIRVSDNGKGIQGNLGDKLFEPNFTTKSSGMGMGLAISRRIIENSNGEISYETELDKGTTFIIKLPIFKVVY